MNGVNGNIPPNMAASGIPVPTPAAHQAELNYIYGMVEELSRQLADNRRVTEDIVSGLGRVRTRAKTQGMGNEELIASAAEEINGQEESLDQRISQLASALEKAEFSRDANAQLLSQYANALAVMLRHLHEYKTRHVTDTSAWHRSYRSQLDEARRENSVLREQIWEMQAHAGSANESLRKFRRVYDEDEERWRRRVEGRAARQEVRFWKRMAMPEVGEDDGFWSGDDDVVDGREKERLRELEREAREQGYEVEEGMGMGGLQQFQGQGGVAMTREDGGEMGAVVPPGRPLSAASSTGSSGQQ